MPCTSATQSDPASNAGGGDVGAVVVGAGVEDGDEVGAVVAVGAGVEAGGDVGAAVDVGADVAGKDGFPVELFGLQPALTPSATPITATADFPMRTKMSRARPSVKPRRLRKQL